MARPPRPIIERFLSKITISITHDYNGTACWEWNGWINKNGYCHTSFKGKGILAHRFIYEYWNGDINSKLTIDHLCRVRHCVNPLHLQQVPHRINILRGDTLAAKNARKTHCKRGHEFTKENTRITGIGSRCCRLCENLRARNNYQKNTGKQILRQKIYRDKNREIINLKKRHHTLNNKLKKQAHLSTN